MRPSDFKRIALGLEGAEEGSHMGAVDFRVGGRIFATLASQDEGYGNLMFDLAAQEEFCLELPEVFRPCPGGWGRKGATHVVLAAADAALLRRALHAAWRIRVEANDRAKKRRGRRP